MTPSPPRPAGPVPYPRVEVGSVVVARDPAGLDLQVVRRPYEAFGPGLHINRATLAGVSPKERKIAKRAGEQIAREVPLLADDVASMRLSGVTYQAERLGGLSDDGQAWRPGPDPWGGGPGYSTYLVAETVYATLTLETAYRLGRDAMSGRSLAATATAVDAQGGDVVGMTEGTVLVRLGALRVATAWCPLPPSAA